MPQAALPIIGGIARAAGPVLARTGAQSAGSAGVGSMLKQGAVFGTGSHLAQGLLGGGAGAAGAAPEPSGGFQSEASAYLNPTQFN